MQINAWKKKILKYYKHTINDLQIAGVYGSSQVSWHYLRFTLRTIPFLHLLSYYTYPVCLSTTEQSKYWLLIVRFSLCQQESHMSQAFKSYYCMKLLKSQLWHRWGKLPFLNPIGYLFVFTIKLGLLENSDLLMSMVVKFSSKILLDMERLIKAFGC